MMKRFKVLLVMIALMLVIGGCQKQIGKTRTNVQIKNNKTLVVYFSLFDNAPYDDNVDASTSASIVATGTQKYGATAYIADLITKKTDAEQFCIEVVDQYATDFELVKARNHEEQNNQNHPRLKTKTLDIAQYDYIFLGYPVWATTIPAAVNSFIDEYDLSQKTIIPFCSHDGYGSGSSYDDIKAASQAKVMPGLAIDSEAITSSQAQIDKWLASLGIDIMPTLQIQIGSQVLQGILNDSSEAKQFKALLPQTISMVRYGSREYYGSIESRISPVSSGQLYFEAGDITYCPTNNTIAIFYNQSEHPDLTMEVYVIGKVTADLKLFDGLEAQEAITFTLQ